MNRLFECVVSGDVSRLEGLKIYLKKTMKPLSHSLYQSHGKTALMKSLLNVSAGENEMVEFLLDIADYMEDTVTLINCSYTSEFYEGQTALHIAIERRNMFYVKKLVKKGANIHARACGKLFQPNSSEASFYFGELPLSLAACTNQTELVDFLLGESASVEEQDSHGNTVLHALVMVAADDSPENTRFITAIYDHILLTTAKMQSLQLPTCRLEAIKNKQGLTPLKLAAKMGKVELFKHILHREFKTKESKYLSRKFTEWSYGPIHCSLYDLESLDTYCADRSILELVVYGSDNPWNQFAGRLFLVHFLVYLLYLCAFTTIAYNKKDMGVRTKIGYMYIVFRLLTFMGSLYFFLRGILDFARKRPTLYNFLIDSYYDVLFFSQGLLFLVAACLYLLSRPEYLGFMIVSMVLGWVNLLYFTRGQKRMGIYSVMIQKVIIGDIIPCFFIYIVFLSGFSAAIVIMLTPHPDWMAVTSEPPVCLAAGEDCSGPDFRNITYTSLELFKLTIGMGDLEFAKGHTRAITTLDLEWGLPLCLRTRLRSGVEKDLSGGMSNEEGKRWCFRVEEVDWSEWRSNLGNIREEPLNTETAPPPPPPTPPTATPQRRRKIIQNVLWLFRQQPSDKQHLENQAT
ncbi:hypothetical protein NHX12_025237 [Muraenolepis orangiensis]|uniref:Uncharacterized protein n=1 Tax=Muraenolepis orangiensis TaxID=630683 RepID=A0A9Q0IPG5_9TELE|nr:hypothetical protein NHX12_025237 [Muraenolepis orangiensis]